MGSDVLCVTFSENHAGKAGLMSCVKRAWSVGHPLISLNWCWLFGMVRCTYICTWMVNFVTDDMKI